jgi:hypothetical protein
MNQAEAKFLPVPEIFAHEARNFYPHCGSAIANFVAINPFRFGPSDAAGSVPGLRESSPGEFTPGGTRYAFD